jgi:S-phase kinase-associated protein 1
MKMTVLLSSDGFKVFMSDDAASASSVITEFMEMFEDADAIPVPGVNFDTLIKVAEFCEFMSHPRKTNHVRSFQQDFFNIMDVKTLFELANAGNYLNIPDLVDGACEAIADALRGKTMYQIQKILGTKDMTPEEIEEVRTAHPWAFEDV